MDEKLPNRTEALALLLSMTPEESQQWARRTAELAEQFNALDKGMRYALAEIAQARKGRWRMNTVEIVECADDAALCRALEAGNGWVIALGRQADGTLEDALIVRNRESGFLAAVPVAEVDRVAGGLPFQVAGAMRDAAARIRTEGAE